MADEKLYFIFVVGDAIPYGYTFDGSIGLLREYIDHRKWILCGETWVNCRHIVAVAEDWDLG